MTTYVEAVDAICGALAAQVDPDRVEWPNVDQAGRPKLFDGTDSWMRLTIRHEATDQTLGEEGQRRYARQGTLVVQTFVQAGKRGLEDAGQWATSARDAYEGKSLGGVRFYRVAVKDVGQDGPWYQVNVEAAFEYDEVK